MTTHNTELESIARQLVAPGKGILAADEVERHDQEALRLDRAASRPKRTAAPIAISCSPLPASSRSERRHPLRRDAAAEVERRPAVRAGARRERGPPRHQGRRRRQAARRSARREDHRGPRRPARALRRVPQARRALHQVARGDRHRRAEGIPPISPSTPTRTRWRATPRSRSSRTWCPSSSPRS